MKIQFLSNFISFLPPCRIVQLRICNFCTKSSKSENDGMQTYIFYCPYETSVEKVITEIKPSLIHIQKMYMASPLKETDNIRILKINRYRYQDNSFVSSKKPIYTYSDDKELLKDIVDMDKLHQLKTLKFKSTNSYTKGIVNSAAKLIKNIISLQQSPLFSSAPRAEKKNNDSSSYEEAILKITAEMHFVCKVVVKSIYITSKLRIGDFTGVKPNIYFINISTKRC